MTRHRIYEVLLRLYPRDFRREYEGELRTTFSQLCESYRGGSGRFWWRILSDVVRSSSREHLDRWTSGQPELGIRWFIACAGGTAASGLVIWLFMLAVEFFFPTRFDADHVARNVSRNLPTGVYGTIIAAVIGAAQASVFIRSIRRRVVWIAATAAGGGAGMPIGFMFANWIGRPPGFPYVAYFSGVALLGALVGLLQTLVVRPGVRQALGWIAWSSVAVVLGIATGIAVSSLFRHRPSLFVLVLVGFVVMPGVIGTVIGALTMRPLTRLARGIAVE